MRARRRLLALLTLACAAAVSMVAAPQAVSAANPPANNSVVVSPYYANGWGAPPDPKTVMTASGVRWFTMAFMLSDERNCTPVWDGYRPISTSSDVDRIDGIRSAGGDVIVSFGGAAGWKLGRNCGTASLLAAAYQKVITKYRLRGIDVDIEAAEFHDKKAVQREIDALKIIQAKNPGIKVFITIPTLKSGPDSWGVQLVSQCSLSHLWITAWVVMPFDMGGTNMGTDTIRATDGLHSVLQKWYGLTSAAAYRVTGISSMNGTTDVGETVTLADFHTIVAYAKKNHLGRLAFWSVNRDRPCAGGPPDSCSKLSQNAWAFSSVLAQYTG